ncbi:hypothetical protein M885DRAFT_622309, partial [Pelagophyceae sp. CCMP2097]
YAIGGRGHCCETASKAADVRARAPTERRRARRSPPRVRKRCLGACTRVRQPATRPGAVSHARGRRCCALFGEVRSILQDHGPEKGKGIIRPTARRDDGTSRRDGGATRRNGCAALRFSARGQNAHVDGGAAPIDGGTAHWHGGAARFDGGTAPVDDGAPSYRAGRRRRAPAQIARGGAYRPRRTDRVV